MADMEQRLNVALAEKDEMQKEVLALREAMEKLTASISKTSAPTQQPPATEDGTASTSSVPECRVDSYRIPEIPGFFRKDPSLWFTRVEATFRNAHISSETTMTDHVMAVLDEDVLSCCRDLIAGAGIVDQYKQIKKRIIDTYSPSEESRLRQLLRGEVLTDGKPSLTLQRLRNLNGGCCSEEVLKSIFMDHLSQQCRAILAGSEVKDLSKLATMADSICEATNSSAQPVFASGTRDGTSPSRTTTDDAISKLTAVVADLAKDVKELQRNSRSQYRQSRSRSNSGQRSQSRPGSPARVDSQLCWAHRKFGEKAYSCKSPCAWPKPRSGE